MKCHCVPLPCRGRVHRHTAEALAFAYWMHEHHITDTTPRSTSEARCTTRMHHSTVLSLHLYRPHSQSRSPWLHWHHLAACEMACTSPYWPPTQKQHLHLRHSKHYTPRTACYYTCTLTSKQWTTQHKPTTLVGPRFKKKTHTTLHYIVPHHCTAARLKHPPTTQLHTHGSQQDWSTTKPRLQGLGGAIPLHYLHPIPHTAAIFAAVAPQEGSTGQGTGPDSAFLAPSAAVLPSEQH
jgi:hypothetical protein